MSGFGSGACRHADGFRVEKFGVGAYRHADGLLERLGADRADHELLLRVLGFRFRVRWERGMRVQGLEFVGRERGYRV